MIDSEYITPSHAAVAALAKFSHAALACADDVVAPLLADGHTEEEIANIIAQVLVRTGCDLTCLAAREMGGGEPSRARWMHTAEVAWDAINPPAPRAAPQEHDHVHP